MGHVRNQKLPPAYEKAFALIDDKKMRGTLRLIGKLSAMAKAQGVEYLGSRGTNVVGHGEGGSLSSIKN